MATIIVPTNGTTVSNVTLNGTLQAVDGTVLTGTPLFYDVVGTSALQSLYVGYDLVLDVGGTVGGTLTGTGSITGPTATSGGTLPVLRNVGTMDINGTIGISLFNENEVTVSSGERLDLQGDLTSIYGTISVAAPGELDLDDPHSALISQLTLQGKQRRGLER